MTLPLGHPAPVAGDASAKPALEIVHVDKEFDDGARRIRVLADVSLRIARGELVAIVGPSGSGKSTLLHLLGGLDVPTRGEIRVEGRALTSLRDDEVTVLRRRRIGFVFQFFNLLPGLTAEENVALPLLLDGVALTKARARVRRMLQLVGLLERASHRPDTLSGGEMQRIALARALIMEPAVVLADEPTGNLDAAAADVVLDLLHDARRTLGQTTVLVTHDARAAKTADRVVTLTDGRIVESSPGSSAARFAARAAPRESPGS